VCPAASFVTFHGQRLDQNDFFRHDFVLAAIAADSMVKCEKFLMEGVSYGKHNQTTNVHCGRVISSRGPGHLDPRYRLYGHWDLSEAEELTFHM
jgi:hypothetical protein